MSNHEELKTLSLMAEWTRDSQLFEKKYVLQQHILATHTYVLQQHILATHTFQWLTDELSREKLEAG